MRCFTRLAEKGVDGEGDQPGEMKMTLYNSRKDLEDGENSQGEATWYRDE
jgi:hypothetical protein